jgi:hypothetical protein
MRFEDPTALATKSAMLWNVILYGLVEVYWHPLETSLNFYQAIRLNIPKDTSVCFSFLVLLSKSHVANCVVEWYRGIVAI